MEYGYQHLDPGSKVQYLLNGIRCNELSTAVVTGRVHQNKYKREFDRVVAFLTQYINKRTPLTNIKVVFVGQIRPAKRQMTSASNGMFKGKFKLKKYSRKNMTQCQWHSANSCKSSGRKPDS